jgi:hypothetical protein
MENYSNQDWIVQTNFKTKEGRAQIEHTSKHAPNNYYDDLLEDLLCDSKQPVPAIADYVLSESEESPENVPELIVELPLQ